MSATTAEAALARAAQQLHDAARGHHKAADFHKARSRELMRQHEQLAEECARLGITLTLTHPQGGTSGHRSASENQAG